MAVIVGQPVSPYDGIIFTPEKVTPGEVIPEGDVALGNLTNTVEVVPVDITIPEGEVSSGNLTNSIGVVPTDSVLPEGDINLGNLINPVDNVPAESIIPEGEVSIGNLNNEIKDVPEDSIVPEGNNTLGNLLNSPDVPLSDDSVPEKSNLIRLSTLALNSTIEENKFYEYQDVIYRCTVEHIWEEVFTSANFIAEGEKFKDELFLIEDNDTNSLVLSANYVGKVILLTVNGVECIEGVHFAKGGTSNRTITFLTPIPYSDSFGPTHIKVLTTPMIY